MSLVGCGLGQWEPEVAAARQQPQTEESRCLNHPAGLGQGHGHLAGLPDEPLVSDKKDSSLRPQKAKTRWTAEDRC